MTSTGLYGGLAIDGPALFSLLKIVGWIWVLGWWMDDDLRRRGEGWFYCPGVFLWLAWPLVLTYYLLKTRGARGLIPIIALVAVCLATHITGAIVGMLLAQSLP